MTERWHIYEYKYLWNVHISASTNSFAPVLSRCQCVFERNKFYFSSLDVFWMRNRQYLTVYAGTTRIYFENARSASIFPSLPNSNGVFIACRTTIKEKGEWWRCRKTFSCFLSRLSTIPDRNFSILYASCIKKKKEGKLTKMPIRFYLFFIYLFTYRW